MRRGMRRAPQGDGKPLEYFYKTTGVLFANHWSTFPLRCGSQPIEMRIPASYSLERGTIFAAEVGWGSTPNQSV